MLYFLNNKILVDFPYCSKVYNAPAAPSLASVPVQAARQSRDGPVPDPHRMCDKGPASISSASYFLIPLARACLPPKRGRQVVWGLVKAPPVRGFLIFVDYFSSGRVILLISTKIMTRIMDRITHRPLGGHRAHRRDRYCEQRTSEQMPETPTKAVAVPPPPGNFPLNGRKSENGSFSHHNRREGRGRAVKDGESARRVKNPRGRGSGVWGFIRFPLGHFKQLVKIQGNTIKQII